MAQQQKTLKVSVVSAEEEIFSGDAYFVELPGAMGALGILPGHAPLMTRIRAGAVQIKTVGGAEELIFVAGGILEVQPDEVTVLADTAVRGEDLEEAKAQQARQTAEAALRNTRVTPRANPLAFSPHEQRIFWTSPPAARSGAVNRRRDDLNTGRRHLRSAAEYGGRRGPGRNCSRLDPHLCGNVRTGQCLPSSGLSTS